MGDVWEGEPVGSDPNRFRVSIFDGVVRRRFWDLEATEVLYGADQVEVDFPGGSGPDGWVSVAQADGRLGWGTEARVRLVV